MTLNEVYKRLDTLIELAGSMRKFARMSGFEPSFISQVKARKSPFSDRLLKAMGLERRAAEFDVIPDYKDITN